MSKSQIKDKSSRSFHKICQHIIFGRQYGEASVGADEAVIGILLMVNEFNIDFLGNESICYYVLVQLWTCGCRIINADSRHNGGSTMACIDLELLC